MSTHMRERATNEERSFHDAQVKACDMRTNNGEVRRMARFFLPGGVFLPYLVIRGLQFLTSSAYYVRIRSITAVNGVSCRRSNMPGRKGAMAYDS